MKNIEKLLLIIVIFLIAFIGCNKNNSSEFVEGFIIASFRCSELDSENGQGTGKLTKRGFFVINKKNADTMYTFSMPENIFDFPQEILTPNSNSDNCGPIYFPDSYEYKIRFKYRNASESEKLFFACGCYDMLLPFNWEAYNQVILEETTTINP